MRLEFGSPGTRRIITLGGPNVLNRDSENGSPTNSSDATHRQSECVSQGLKTPILSVHGGHGC